MSLLWKTAMAWHDDDRSDEDSEHSHRDERPYHERRKGYVDHISSVHDIHPDQAENALGAVEDGLNRGQHMGHSTDYGFTQYHDLDKRTDHPFPEHVKKAVHNADNWRKGAQVEDVPLHQMHATQSWVRHGGVAHNLFHPGQRSPWEDGVEGDPDYDPEWDEDSWHEEDEARKNDKSDPHVHYDSKSDHHGVSHLPRVYRNEHGEQWAMDGHHRLAAEMALSKPRTKALVLQSEHDDDTGEVKHSWEHPEHFGIERDEDEH